jgi:hypothetical protein
MDETSEPESDGAITAPDAAETAEMPREGVSRTVLVVSVIAALLIAGVAGVAIGWKVEQQRVKDDLSSIRAIGTVTKVTDDSMTLKLVTSDGNRTYRITKTTEVAGGDVSDVAKGSTVLVRSWRGSGDTLEAKQIVVLPSSAPADG